MKQMKKICLWVTVGFFALMALVTIPSFACVIAVVAALLIAPVEHWQGFLRKYIKGKIKTLAVIILTVIMFFTFPDSDKSVDNSIPDESTSVTTVSTDAAAVAATTVETTVVQTNAQTDEVTTESVTTVVTEPATTTVAESTATATQAATTPPSEPASEPTTEPTAAPATEEVTEPPHAHSFNDATCTAPKTCACGATEGEANGHAWNNTTCSAPKTCSVCGTIEGTTANHSFANGNCVDCGAEDPNYTRETMVWIPTKGGTKYHNNSECSNMEDPEYVTQSEAESRGYTACKKCY